MTGAPVPAPQGPPLAALPTEVSPLGAAMTQEAMFRPEAAISPPLVCCLDSAWGAVAGRAQTFGPTGLFPRERGLQVSRVPGALSITLMLQNRAEALGDNRQQTSAELTQFAGSPTVKAKARRSHTARANTGTVTTERVAR